jgi:Anti-sigma factor NepR
MIKPLPPAPSDTPSAAPKKSSAAEPKGAEISNQIGGKLRAMFDDVVAEPVPERFHKLLEELQRKSGAQ